MKKIIIAIAVLLNCTFIMAQTEFDALKYVQTDISGTARYMSMAGAFGALGGDASSIKDNPAGLGIYRSSELVGTLNVMMQKSSANWNGVNTNNDLYKTGANNFSVIVALPTWRNENETNGLLSSNFSFSYNRIKDFNRSLNVKSGTSSSSMTDYMAYFTDKIPSADLTYTSSYEPFDNINVPWISELAYEGGLMKEHFDANGKTDFWESLLNLNEKVTPSYYLSEKGYIDEYSLGWAGNFSNIFYFGATANIKAINYSAISKYSELFDGGGSMNLMDSVYTNGTGINLNIGTIYRPNDFLRFGLSLHTPTVFMLNDNYYSKLNFDSSVKGYIRTPGGTSAYQLQSPLQINASAAFIVGKKGIISAEYDYSNYTGIRLMSEKGDSQDFSDENQGMNDMLNDVSTIKIGAEYKLTNNFSLRAGYANSSNATKNTAAKLMRFNTVRTDTEYFLNNSTNYLSAGFGYREANWFIDLAYMNKIMDESFYPYNTNKIAESNPSLAVSPASVITTNSNIIVTVGLKF